jgi:hypothetical protein
MNNMKRIASAFQHDFSKLPQVHRPRSAFKCDHTYKTTFNAGYLIPFFWDEVNPGDTVKLGVTGMVRFATLLFPLMDNMRFYMHYFFVPNRLLWSHWVNFMGEQANPNDSISYTVPKMQATASTGYAETSVFDYFGLPTKIPGYYHISLPLRAYNLIYNYWFRSEDLQNSVTVRLSDGSDVPGDFTLLQSNKIRDYFTSGLPNTQKGTLVTVPLGTTAPVISSGTHVQFADIANTANFATATYQSAVTSRIDLSTPSGGSLAGGTTLQFLTTNTGLYADLTNASAATINSLRTAFQIQRFLERDQRSGTRYPEHVQAHWGVSNPDARVQWPELLHSSSDPVHISVVAQTSGTSITGESTPQANLAGFGTAVVMDPGFVRSFTEHGQLIGILIARADITYQQGLNRKWSRSIRYDYPYPVFAHLGEQPILNQEIYTEGTGGSDDLLTFAYQERYAENRYFPNQISGLLRTNATGTLDSWHLAQNFSSLPTLGTTFLNDSPPTTRVKANSSDPDFIGDFRFNHTIVSVLPSYSVPGQIDHH